MSQLSPSPCSPRAGPTGRNRPVQRVWAPKSPFCSDDKAEIQQRKLFQPRDSVKMLKPGINPDLLRPTPTPGNHTTPPNFPKKLGTSMIFVWKLQDISLKVIKKLCFVLNPIVHPMHGSLFTSIFYCYFPLDTTRYQLGKD